MVRSWLTRSHSGLQELAVLAALYAVYEVIRGAAGENAAAALRHTSQIVALERDLGVYVEHGVQNTAAAIPLVPMLLGVAYIVLQFLGTTLALVWVHRRHPDGFPLIRTTFVFATALALVGYLVFPAAPPRLAGLGFSDTVTASGGFNLSSDLLSVLYNPFAAVPSLHFGYSLIVGAALVTLSSRRWVRLAGALYPLVMLLVIVGTGNHFFLDAALGGVVVVAGWLAARVVLATRVRPEVAPRTAPSLALTLTQAPTLPQSAHELAADERLAA